MACCDNPLTIGRKSECHNCGHGMTCSDCGRLLDKAKVFGMCRGCAEARHAARQARKMLNQVVGVHGQKE